MFIFVKKFLTWVYWVMEKDSRMDWLYPEQMLDEHWSLNTKSTQDSLKIWRGRRRSSRNSELPDYPRISKFGSLGFRALTPVFGYSNFLIHWVFKVPSIAGYRYLYFLLGIIFQCFDSHMVDMRNQTARLRAHCSRITHILPVNQLSPSHLPIKFSNNLG